MIAKFRPGMYKWSLPALAVCLALVAVSLTNAQTPALPQVTRHEKPVQSPFPPPPTPPQPAGDLRLPSSYLSADLYEKLRKSYSKIAFTSEPFSSAVEAIRKATGVDIQIDRNKYPPEGKTVSLKPLDAPLSTVIDLLCRQVERKWAACHDTIFISDDEGLRKWLDENDIDADTVQVRKKLQKRLPYFEFSGQPFFAMIEVLRSTTQLNLVLDPNVPVQDKTITLQLTDASVETILKLLTVQVGVNWGIVKNFIYISDDEGIRKLFSQGPKGFESDAEALEVEKKLQNRIPYVEFAGQPFMTVIALVGSKAGLNIVVDPGPAPTPDRVITVTIENATVKSIIDLVTAQVGLNWTITENFVYISDDEGIRNLLSRQPRSKAQVSDIWITPEDITLIEGDYCRFISAAIHTKGSGVIPNVQVRFYLGDPDKGGKLIGEGGLSIEAGKTAREAIPWDAAPGRHEIYAIVDPDNNITETDETNNRASAMVTIEAPFKLKEKAGAETK